MESTESKFALTSASSFLLSASTLLLAGAILLIGYIVSRVSRSGAARSKNAAQSEGKSEESREFEAGQAQTQAGSGAVGSSSGKRAKKEKKRRGPQQEFSHPWMVGALKGHTAPVLDMNFSSNGKFLASCAEDCGLRPEEEVLDPGEEEEEEDEEDADRYAAKPSPKEEEEDDEEGDEEEEEDEEVDAREKTVPREKSPTKKAPTPAVPAGPAPAARSSKDDKAILSRRQRKNRTRAPRDCREDDEHHAQQQQSQQQQQQHQQQQQQQSQQQQQQQQQSNQQQSSQQSRRRRQQRQQSPKQAKKTPAPREVKATATEQHVSASRKSKIISSQRKELRHLSDAALASLLRRYTLSGDQLAHLGYPVECSYFPGYAVIISHHHPILHRTPRVHHHHRLDVNAREFVPGSSSLIESEADSGNGSGSSLESSDLESSDSDKSSDICDSSSSSSSSSSLSSSSSSCSYQKRRVSTPDPEVILERRCARCFKMFYVNEGGEYLQEERCVYHWGKLRSGLIDEGGHHGDTWECCRGHGASRGCTTAKMHVWTGLLPGYNGPFEGYVRTRPSRNPPKDGNYGVYALDCEMCFTRRGLELAKVTVVGVDGKIVYDALVRPDCDVIDHNTRFSGITAKDLAKATKRLKDVQRDITNFVYAETILIGHGLENDLRALRILHTTVIDTCVAFPHFLGYPYRSSLKTLARTVLRREIQVTEHDSVEDARIAIDLMLRRLQHDLS